MHPGNWEPDTRIKIFDAILIVILLGIASFPIYRGIQARKGSHALIFFKDQLKLTIDLAVDGVYSIDGELGIMTFQVIAGKIKVTETLCPNRLCQKRGGISKSGEQIICVPNEVSILIIGEGEIDEISG